jgi:hypothetical protein
MSNPAKTRQDVADMSDLLTETEQRAVECFREYLKDNYYAGREYCSISVGIYTGETAPEEFEDHILKFPLLSCSPRFIETVCRRVAQLARALDPQTPAQSGDSETEFMGKLRSGRFDAEKKQAWKLIERLEKKPLNEQSRGGGVANARTSGSPQHQATVAV